MKSIITIIQIAVSVSLAILILLQSRGTGLGSSFGGGGEFYRSKRGLEKILFKLTLILAVVFLISSLINFVVQ